MRVRLESNRRSLVAAVSVACALAALPSRGLAGELAEDAHRVETVWATTSQRVIHLAPEFLAADDVRPIALAKATLSPADSLCTTIGVLGAPTLDFSLELRGDETSTPKSVTREGDGVRSVAGALTVVRCGADRERLEGIAIHMKSPQGAVEVLVARGAQPAPSLDSLFPERMAGPAVPEAERPPPLVTSSRAARLADAEQVMLQAGGRLITKQEVTSDSDGRGSLRLSLAEGCHRLVVVAEARNAGRPVPIDVDCELANARTRETLVRDRSFAPDGVIDFCTGDPMEVLLRWAGAPGAAPTTVLEGYWAVPSFVPAEWPSRARAGLAQALLRRLVPLGNARPVWAASGVTARTMVPVPVAAGTCYVFGLGASSGEVRAIRVAAQLGAQLATDSGIVGGDGAAVSFCATSPGVARIDINAIGSQVVWFGGLWNVGTVPLGLEESK